jgi:hypothetical protein
MPLHQQRKFHSESRIFYEQKPVESQRETVAFCPGHSF